MINDFIYLGESKDLIKLFIYLQSLIYFNVLHLSHLYFILSFDHFCNLVMIALI